MRDEEIRQVSETVEIACWEDVFAAAPPRLRASLELSASRHAGGMVLTARGVDHPLLNRAFALGSDGVISPDELRRVIERYESLGIQRFFVQPVPSARPDDLDRALTDLGLVPYRRAWDQLVHTGEREVPDIETPFRVALVGPDRGADLAHILEVCFDLPRDAALLWSGIPGRPRWRTYMAFDGDRAVAVGLLFLDGGAGYLAAGATLPDARGRGAQGALMARRVRDALALGCRVIATETGEEIPGEPNPSHNNMVRCGFRVLYKRPNWTRPGIAWSGASPPSVSGGAPA